MTKIIHQIWLGTRPLPERFARYAQTWRDHHADWEYRLWTDADAADVDLRCRDAYDRSANLGMRADILRLEILHRHGGLYADLDTRCVRPLDWLFIKLGACTTFMGREFRASIGQWWLCNAVIGAAPGASFLRRALDAVPAAQARAEAQFGTDTFAKVLHTAGPWMISPLANADPTVQQLPRCLFYSPVADDPRAYCFHDFAGTWMAPAAAGNAT